MHICRNSLHCTVLKNKIDFNEESGTKVSGSFLVCEDSKGDAYAKEPALHTACNCVVGPQNVKDYLAFDKVLACDGTWMVKDALINGGEFEKIKEMTKEAVDIVK